MKRLNITNTILDKLGFSEYWDEHGTWGTRTLSFSNGIDFTIIEQEEMDNDTYGYGDGCYVANHWYFSSDLPSINHPLKGSHDLFFIHEMYDCIEKYYPECLEEFTQICISLKMHCYLKVN